jgi:hypothetical protein
MMRDMTERPGQQPPQDPRSSEGTREVLEGRVIPSRSQAQRQYDARPPKHAASQDDPRQPYAAPPAGSESGAAPQAPASGPAWSPQQQPQGGVPQQQGNQAGPQGYAPQPAAQGPQDPPGAPPAPGADEQAAAVQQRIQQIRQATATEKPRPAGPPPSGPGTPDWTALAEQQAAAAARRRKVMMLTGGIVAVAVIAGGVAAAVVMSGKSSGSAAASPSAASHTSASQQSLPPAPSFSPVAPPPANPLDYLGTAAKDKAPISPQSLFPDPRFQMNGRTYVRTATATTTNCASAARDQLAAGLSANGCSRLIRATYTNGNVAITVGVAVFADTQHAAKLQKTAKYVAPLNGGPVKDFCHAVACQMTSNVVGRYGYFAISGLENGKTLAPTDTVARRAANEASNYAFGRIIQHGRDEAAADTGR